MPKDLKGLHVNLCVVLLGRRLTSWLTSMHAQNASPCDGYTISTYEQVMITCDSGPSISLNLQRVHK